MKPKRERLRFQVHVVDHCNLNCKYCDNFSPIADEKFLLIESYERDCARLSYLTGGEVEEIVLQGGEPLLHKEIIQFFVITRKYFKNTVISLVTNGILLLKQSDDFWNTCHTYKIQLIVTKYPLKLDFEKMKETARNFKVFFDFFNISLDKEASKETMNLMPLDIKGGRNADESYRLCFKGNLCICLDEGKLYTCPTIPYIKYFNKRFNKNLEVTPEDYIDIYDAKNIDEILTRLSEPAPFCRYCALEWSIMDSFKWGVSKGEISEWVMDTPLLKKYWK